MHCRAALVGLVFASTVFASQGAGALGPTRHYPQNPYLDADAIYLSDAGVTRFERKTLAPVWDALDGLKTFEPVVTAQHILVGSSRGLYALEPDTGGIAWHFPSKAPLFSPAVMEGMAYVGGEDGSLRAIDLATGTARWERTFEGWIYPPAVAGERLVVGGSGGRLHGIDQRTGDVEWSKSINQELVYRPIEISGEKVIVTTFGAEVLAVSAADGGIVWRVEDPVPSFPPAVRSDRLFLGAFDGGLRARDSRDGALLWEQRVDAKLPFMPETAPGYVLVGSDQGHLAAFSPTSGRRLWQLQQGGVLVARPILIDGKVIVFSPGRRVVALPDPPIPVVAATTGSKQ